MAVESITKTLGAGSGIDIGALVTSLVSAQFSTKNAELTRREEALTAKISGVSALRGAITGFDAALKALSTGGTLRTQAVSANPALVKATALEGADVSGLNARVGVAQLASAQATTTNAAVPRASAFRTGTIRIQLGTDVVNSGGTTTGFTAQGAPVDIAIGAADATLDGIAAKVNAANSGVTATVVNDGTGARLTFKSASGAAKAFTITGTNTGATGNSLATLNGGGTTTGSTTTGTRARDARVLIDGATFARPTNTIDDLVPGVRLELLGLAATPVGLSATSPGSALTTGVNDFVATFNEMLSVLKEQNDPVDGALRSDPAVAALGRELRKLSTVALIPAGAAGAPRTLADIGVRTARDGTLSVDAARLAKVLVEFPTAVEKMFAPAKSGSPDGLSATMSGIATRMTSRTAGLDSSGATYARQKAALFEQKAEAAKRAASTTDRLTRQFTTMDARAAAYKSTGTFLENQIKAWNRSDA